MSYAAPGVGHFVHSSPRTPTPPDHRCDFGSHDVRRGEHIERRIAQHRPAIEHDRVLSHDTDPSSTVPRACGPSAEHGCIAARRCWGAVRRPVAAEGWPGREWSLRNDHWCREWSLRNDLCGREWSWSFREPWVAASGMRRPAPDARPGVTHCPADSYVPVDECTMRSTPGRRTHDRGDRGGKWSTPYTPTSWDWSTVMSVTWYQVSDSIQTPPSNRTSVR